MEKGVQKSARVGFLRTGWDVRHISKKQKSRPKERSKRHRTASPYRFFWWAQSSEVE